MSDQTVPTTEQVSFKITVPHNDEADWHEWWFPGAWPNHQATVMRDRRGRRMREGFYGQHWLVLKCNNTECPAEALVPVRFVLDHADAQEPLSRTGGES